VCQGCHGLIHEGRLIVEGEAPYRLKWKGADGRPLDELLSGMEKRKRRYRVERGVDAPRGAFQNLIESEDTAIYSLDDIPDEIDSAWWQKHAHNFVFKGNRIVLKNAL